MNSAIGYKSTADELEIIRQLELADTFFSHSVSCLVILDRDYNFIRVNQAYADACRRDINDFAGHNHFDLYPSDAKQIFDEVLQSKRPYITFTRAFEFADQPERGVTYWDWTLVPVLDAQEEVEFLVFSLIDVTETKRASEALRIAALVYQHSSDAMMVTDGDNRIIATNEAFSRITGYSAEDIRGRNTAILRSPDQPPQVFDTMSRALAQSGHWKGELWARTKKETSIAIELTINTVYTDDGMVDRRVALFSDITKEKEAAALIWQQANFDALTKLPNRYMFTDGLRKALDRAAASKSQVAVLLIDLDQFKEVNDTLGHDEGDSLLIEVSRRIAKCIPANTLCARLGGDEFAVCLTEPQNLHDPTKIATQIISEVSSPYLLSNETVFISASVGIAIYPEDGTDFEMLLKHADQAMYAAKASGRECFMRFTNALQDEIMQRRRLTNNIRLALHEGQFDLHYQPIVDLATGRVRKAEALIRWNHPVLGVISPLDFIPLAEASGLIQGVGEWVFERAIEEFTRLRQQNIEPLQLSVNVSPLQFRNSPGFSQRWLDYLAAHNVPAGDIVLEITEGLLLDWTEKVRDELRTFSAAGVHISLDDFGTGYSSLAYLRKFKIDYIKIDRTFIRNLESEYDDRALCEAIIVMAHKLGLKVIAEGVETAAQRDFLAANGCDYGQGFLFSKPLPASAFERLLAWCSSKQMD